MDFSRLYLYVALQYKYLDTCLKQPIPGTQTFMPITQIFVPVENQTCTPLVAQSGSLRTLTMWFVIIYTLTLSFPMTQLFLDC